MTALSKSQFVAKLTAIPNKPGAGLKIDYSIASDTFQIETPLSSLQITQLHSQNVDFDIRYDDISGSELVWFYWGSSGPLWSLSTASGISVSISEK